MFTDAHWAMVKGLAPRLRGYAFALTHDPDRTADLVQDAILRGMQSGRVPSDDRAFRVWLMRILRNLWIDGHRAAQRQGETCPIQSDDDEALPPALIDEGLVVNRLVVRQAFFTLSAAHRDVLALVDIGGFSYDEAAELLHTNRGTIMSRVARARQNLIEALAETPVVPLRRAAARGKP